MSDGVIRTNPAAGHRLVSKLERREMQVLQPGSTRSSPRRRMIRTARSGPLTTGLRPSEALGLRWSDLRRADLRVTRKLGRPENSEQWVLEDVKTAKGRRVVSLIPLAADALTRQRDRQAVEQLVAGDGYTDHGLVFADPRGHPLRADGLYKYHWQPTLKRLKLPPVRLYDARHSAATMLLEAGVPMKVVQEMLGHSSMTITSDVYSHVTPAFKQQASDALAAYLDATALAARKAEAEGGV